MTLVSGDGVSQGNLGPEQNCWSWKNCTGNSSRGGIWGPGARSNKGEHSGTEELRADRGRQAQGRESPEQQRVCCRPWEGESGHLVGPRWGLGLTLQTVPVGAGAGGRWGGLGSDDRRKSTLLFHG